MIGSLLGNRYEIMEQLGGGGMAIVYKGRDVILNRLVTIKVLREEYTSDEDFVKRFRSEAQAVASLSHPNIVSIYDVGRAADVDYLVMEYIEGDDLKTVIKRHAPLTPVKAAQIAMQIAQALEHAHENNIVHRDVKPQNVLITRGGLAKLTDFGIAMGATAGTIVKTDEVMGSVHYVSPEQAKGEKTGPRSDIYSLGVVLYEMTTGALPFDGDNPVGVALKHVREDALLPSQVNPAIPLRLENIITAAMAKNPSRRFENARQMVVELAGVAGISAEPVDSDAQDEFKTRKIPRVNPNADYDYENDDPEPPQPPRKRSYGWLWALIIVLIISGAGGAFFQYFLNVKEVTMVDLVTMTREQAENKLDELGLTSVEWKEEYDNDTPKGQVTQQTPAGGLRIKVTRPVEVVVSLGQKTVTVPGVIGLEQYEAVNRLANVGLPSGQGVISEYSEQYEAGTVMDQNPKENDIVNEGTAVVLTVSKGKQQIISQMPPLVGITLEKAREELSKVMLTLQDDAVNNVGSEIYDSGIVTGQHPAAGVEVKEGDIVRLTVSSGPGPKVYSAQVTANIKDSRNNSLRVYVTDIKGTGRLALDEIIDTPGMVVKYVEYYGEDVATVEAYLNDYLMSIQRFKGGRQIE